MSGLTPSLVLMRKIRTAAKTTQEWFFRVMMRDIKKMNSNVYDKLMEIPLDKWACHASIVKRYGIAYTNHVKCWNNMIKDDRALPVVCLVEAIREYLSAHYFKYRKLADDWAARGGRFTPRATVGIPSKEQWDVDEEEERVLPPPLKRKPGRISMKRMKIRGEHKGLKRKRCCTLCNMEGHNGRTCKNFVDDKGVEHHPANPEAVDKGRRL
ncbi:hypothetical protein IFM89_035840 [Coptis chinensis]|uniref:Uncharacterized protein n=1 Tax=Coptis chinensis TaxID=261450 RepID=A0A835HRR2_9MAGN|nr:hypothetical protein IFM89_035840 [Coptis chinensis]